MAFPEDITTVLVNHLPTVGQHLSPSVTLPILQRPTRATDPAQCLAVFPLEWVPEDEFEIASDKLGQPLLMRYWWEVQAFVKVGEQESGLRQIANLSKIVRSMLYRDQVLAVALRQLSDTSFDFVERVKRWGTPGQVYYSNELKGSFLYLSTMPFWVEVEAVPAA